MKKFLTLLVSICMLFTLAACGSSTTDDTTADDTATEVTYKLGMGTDLSMDSSTDGNAQVDAAVVAVVTDADGKIVACTIDTIQNKMDVTAGTVDATKEFKTKMELGDDYNMKTYSTAVAEWYDQANAFAAYCVGKTGDEIANMETTINEEGYDVTTDETLYASCSISIGSFQRAVAKACADEQGMEFTTSEEFKLGVGVESYVYGEKSADATADADGAVCMESDYSAAVVNNDGVILACVTDSIQPVIGFTAEGVITDKTFGGTKRELKEGYNMVAYNPSALQEWYLQAKGFEEYCVGKTAAEVENIETTTNEEGYQVATDEALTASCTIQITGMQNTVARAATLALNPLH